MTSKGEIQTLGGYIDRVLKHTGSVDKDLQLVKVNFGGYFHPQTLHQNSLDLVHQRTGVDYR